MIIRGVWCTNKDYNAMIIILRLVILQLFSISVNLFGSLKLKWNVQCIMQTYTFV